MRRCEQRDLQLEQKHRRQEASANAEVGGPVGPSALGPVVQGAGLLIDP